MPYRRPATSPAIFELQSLEARQFLSATPASPRSDTLGVFLDKGERQVLASRLTGLPSATRAALLNSTTNYGSFDGTLDDYFKGRPSPYFFDESQAQSTADFVRQNLGSSFEVSQIDPVVGDHKFLDGTGANRVDLPDQINWLDGHPAGTTDPDFPNILNRNNEWVDLARAGLYTGDGKYINELRYELASFSQQFYTLDVPADWDADDKMGWQYTSALRGANWAESYFTTLGQSGWADSDNTLFLYKIMQQGDALYQFASNTTDYGSNRTLALGKSLMTLGEAFHEFDAAANWEQAGRNLLYAAMDAQFYNDGSHVEQSPTYTAAVLGDLLDARRLDRINGHDWPAEREGRLANAVESYYQFLTPDGRTPAIGDAYRSPAAAIFLKADLVLNTSDFPAARPRSDDAWLFGADAVRPYLSNDTYPAIGNRGEDFALPDSGNYFMRSANGQRQITLDAGPKGGIHGHADLFNFELVSGGRPLVIDPGAYKYVNSPDRDYVLSTKAHNTLNVDGQNVASLEGHQNPGITVDQYSTSAAASQITATHRGYAYLPGAPVVTRSVWYDHDGAMLVVDFAESTSAHDYAQSFNLSALPDADVRRPESDGSFRTRYASGDNVQITPLNGGTVERGSLTFVTNRGEGDFKQDAWRFRVDKKGVQNAVFATLLNVYGGVNPPAGVSAQVITQNPSPDKPLVIRLTRNGQTQDVTFNPPALDRVNNSTNSIDQGRAGVNDIAYDAQGRLHLVYQDRAANALMYAVKDTNGQWSVPQAIDEGQYLGEYLDLTLDNTGSPGVAYFDGYNGDLKYAHLSHVTNAWEAETIDSKGSVGLYPNLAYTRNGTGGAAISYYDRRVGALKLAIFQGDHWDIQIVDSASGDAGRFSDLQLDPNRPDASKFVIGYEDTREGRYKFAAQYRDGWLTQVVDDQMTAAGGYFSLAFYDTGSSDAATRYRPAASYYDVSRANGTALKFSYSDGKTWHPEIVDNNRKRGLYSRLFFDGAGKNARATILYYDRQNDLERSAAGPIGGNWAYNVLANGGREIHVARDGGKTAYTNLDEANATLDVSFI